MVLPEQRRRAPEGCLKLLPIGAGRLGIGQKQSVLLILAEQQQTLTGYDIIGKQIAGPRALRTVFIIEIGRIPAALLRCEKVSQNTVENVYHGGQILQPFAARGRQRKQLSDPGAFPGKS